MENKEELSAVILNEVQLILAEKRTSLAMMRTGIAVFALPLSVLSLLIATSKYYNIFNALPLFMPLAAINLGLVCLGTYLVAKSIGKIRRFERHIEMLKQKHTRLSEFLD